MSNYVQTYDGINFSIEYDGSKFDLIQDQVEYFSAIDAEKLFKLFKTNSQEFCKQIIELINNLIDNSSSTYYQLKYLNILKNLKNIIVNSSKNFILFLDEYKISPDDFATNITNFFAYSEKLNGTDNERLLKTYLYYCKNRMPIFIKSLNTNSCFTNLYKEAIEDTNYNLQIIHAENDIIQLLENADIEKIEKYSKRNFRNFLIHKFKKRNYTIKPLSKGAAFVISKENDTALIEINVFKRKINLDDIQNDLLAIRYLNIPELWIYSLSGFTQDIIDYANETNNIKLLGKNEIEKLTKM